MQQSHISNVQFQLKCPVFKMYYKIVVQAVVCYMLSPCSIGSLFYKHLLLSIRDRSVPVYNVLFVSLRVCLFFVFL
jgi:hypothetical protein